ncbi:hypothetical protein [Litoreibacter halocynthiae]|uniref:hypothetical protein n=1 Tax=Litoreibacter halocynthiae TaxID=1242689 RepID=UPI00248FE695|nr:hypothetical protein [Litoreibacter halocynthiae]
MEFEAVSATRMIALMLVGGAFAFAGLYMMLRPRPEGAAKIELFGLKFESSSAGLLVFLVGAAFLSVTLFVPERQTVSTQVDIVPVAGDSKEAPKPVSAEESNQVSEIAVLEESEPNDGVRDADPLQIGQVVAGRFKNQAGDVDWYSVSFDSGNIAQHEIKLRHVNGNRVAVTVYDLREQEIGRISTNSGVAYLPLKDLTTSKIFLKVTGATGGWNSDTYEVSVELK